MSKLATWARLKSPWVLHFNSGACNGCDIEVVALLTPRFDVERFGIKLEPSPRHADVLLVTGSVTQQCAERLKRIYEQMPEPKFVVAIGACACSGGVFRGNYNVLTLSCALKLSKLKALEPSSSIETFHNAALVVMRIYKLMAIADTDVSQFAIIASAILIGLEVVRKSTQISGILLPP